MKIYEITEAEDETLARSEFPKIRADVKQNIDGQPHIGIEYANGDMWIVPQATDGNPVFTNKSIENNNLLKRQLTAKGVGFPLKYNGLYDKRDGKWMHQNDINASNDSAEDKQDAANKAARAKNIQDLKAAGVDFKAELAKAQAAGRWPDPRIETQSEFLAYLMQQAGVRDNTPSSKGQSSGDNWDDDGTTFKDTSKFVRANATQSAPDSQNDDMFGDEMDDIDRMLRNAGV